MIKVGAATEIEDQTIGIRILSRAIEEPLRQIVENAGEDAAVVLNALESAKSIGSALVILRAARRF